MRFRDLLLIMTFLFSLALATPAMAVSRLTVSNATVSNATVSNAAVSDLRTIARFLKVLLASVDPGSYKTLSGDSKELRDDCARGVKIESRLAQTLASIPRSGLRKMPVTMALYLPPQTRRLIDQDQAALDGLSQSVKRVFHDLYDVHIEPILPQQQWVSRLFSLKENMAVISSPFHGTSYERFTSLQIHDPNHLVANARAYFEILRNVVVPSTVGGMPQFNQCVQMIDKTNLAEVSR